jgi:hypothetical protein
MIIALALRLLRVSAVLLLFLLVSFVQGGCTTAYITSFPSNADVLLSSQQSEWQARCRTPCSISLFQRHSKIKVQWLDNSASDILETDIVFPLFQTLNMHYTKPSVPVAQPNQIELFSPTVLPMIFGPEMCE